MTAEIPGGSEDTSLCRMTKLGLLTRFDYEYRSSVQCYRYLSSVFADFQPKLELNPQNDLYYFESPLVKNAAINNNNYTMFESERVVLYDPSLLASVDLLGMTMSEREFRKWRECCDAAMRCCDAQLASTLNPLGSNS